MHNQDKDIVFEKKLNNNASPINKPNRITPKDLSLIKPLLKTKLSKKNLN